MALFSLRNMALAMAVWFAVLALLTAITGVQPSSLSAVLDKVLIAALYLLLALEV
jgi:hypothetical protein